MIVGAGLFTVKVAVPDVPPPGAGLVTVTLGVPAVATSATVICAVICVALTNAVVFAAPPKFTTEPVTKFVPLTVNVNAAPPAVALVGEIVVMVGDGKFTVVGSVAVFPVVPESLVVVTVAELIGVPAAAAATFTTKLNALVPLVAAIAAELVHVTVWETVTHDHTPELVLLLNDIPVGRVSVTVVVPVVGEPPVLDTVIVYVPVWPTVKFPVCTFPIVTSGAMPVPFSVTV